MRPFPEEVARLEAQLWQRLSRTLSRDAVDVLRRGGFQHDVFPLGRGPVRIRYESDGKTNELIIGSFTSRSTGSPRLDPELDRILGR